MKAQFKVAVRLLSPMLGLALLPLSPAKGQEGTNDKPAKADTEVKADAKADPKAEAKAADASPAPSTAGATNVTNVSTNEPVVLKEIRPAIPNNAKLSKPAQDIVKMAQAGVSEGVLLAYIEKQEAEFKLSADDILYMNDVGISQNVIGSMLTHDGADPKLAAAAVTQEGNAPEQKGPPPSQPGTAAPGTPAAAPVAAAPGVAAPGAPVAAGPAPSAQGQVEVTANYIPNNPQVVTTQQPVVVQQQPTVVQQPVIVQQEPVVVQQPVVIEDPASTYSYFYSDLSPYGSWVLVSGYGWCWRPTVSVVNVGWRPYCHGGRWLWSDCGWYWQSDYTWGWAPFHYGRWFYAGHHGWCWTPDYVWGPSWVTWRNHNDYCGWAPLPPHARFHEGVGFTYYDRNVGVSFSFGLGYEHYTFVPTRHFYERRVAEHLVPTRQTINIYNNSVVVNNYSRGSDHTVVNSGISREKIAGASHYEIRKVSVRDMSSGGGRTVAPEKVAREGRDLVVYRPKPPSQQMEHQLESKREQEVRKTLAIAPAPAGQAIPSRSPASATGHNGIAAQPNLSPRAWTQREGTSPGVSRQATREQGRTEVETRSSLASAPKPPPVVPERTPVFTPTRTRARQESVSTARTPATPAAGPGRTIAPATPSSSGREAISSQSRGVATPSAGSTTTVTPRGVESSRSIEPNRGFTATPSRTPAPGTTTQPSVGSNTRVAEPARQAAPGRGFSATPPASSTSRLAENETPTFSARSAQPSTPATTPNYDRSVQWNTPARPPTTVQPNAGANNVTAPVRPSVAPQPSTRSALPNSGYNNPAVQQQVPQQPRTFQVPQQTPQQQYRPATPPPTFNPAPSMPATRRQESFSAPPIQQTSPAISQPREAVPAYQPRAFTPVPSAPAYVPPSAPAQNVYTRPAPSVNPGQASGQTSVRSYPAPAAPAASAPQAAPQPANRGGGGRGRVEIPHRH